MQKAKAKQGKSKNSASFPPKSPETKKKRVKKVTKRTKSKEEENLGDYSSDDIEDLSDTEVSVATPKTVSSRTSTGSRQRLPNHVEKQLIIDIENSGGIHHFGEGKKQGLRDLLDSSDFSEYYGNVGDDLRRKISKKVHYFKTNLDKYDRLRQAYCIPPTKHTAAELRQLRSTPSKRRIPIFEDSSYVSDLEDPSVTSLIKDSPVVALHKDSSKKKSIKKRTSVLTSRQELFKSPPRRPSGAYRDHHLVKEDHSDSDSDTMSKNKEKLESYIIDMDDPYQVRGLRISKVEGFKFEGSKYDGIAVQVLADPRDIRRKGIKLCCHKEKPTSEIMLSMPYAEAPFWEEKCEYDEFNGEANQLVLVESEAVAITSYKLLPISEKERNLLLKFPPRMCLTDKPFVPKGKSTEKFQLIMHPRFTTPVNPFDEKKHFTVNKATWLLIDLNSEKAMEDEDEDDSETAELARQMARNGLGNSFPASSSSSNNFTDSKMDGYNPDNPFGETENEGKRNKKILTRFFRTALQKNRLYNPFGGAEDEAEEIWKQTWEEALSMGYPNMPKQKEPMIDRAAFSEAFTEWKWHVLELNHKCVEAKRAGYGIPENFADFSVEQRDVMVQAYQEWRKQRGEQLDHFIFQATDAGYTLPDDVRDLNFAEQELLFEKFLEWSKKRGSPVTNKLMTQLPSEAEVVLKTKADRKDAFKQTVDSDKARRDRAENRKEAAKAKRDLALDIRRGRKPGPPNKKPSSAGQLGYPSVDQSSVVEGNAHAPVRRSSNRIRRPSQKQSEDANNGEHHQVQSVDSFVVKLDDLANEFNTDVLGDYCQLETELNKNTTGGPGFGSFDDEIY